MKVLISASLGALLTAGVIGLVLLSPGQNNSKQESTTSRDSNIAATPSPAADANAQTSSVTGQYVTYSAATASDADYAETILFFHAPWCPECRAFEKSIQSGDIPDGVQILKVDYDSSSDLKSKYGVTLQTTFVKIAANGSKVSSWVGYGKDKTIAAILENT